MIKLKDVIPVTIILNNNLIRLDTSSYIYHTDSLTGDFEIHQERSWVFIDVSSHDPFNLSKDFIEI